MAIVGFCSTPDAGVCLHPRFSLLGSPSPTVGSSGWRNPWANSSISTTSAGDEHHPAPSAASGRHHQTPTGSGGRQSTNCSASTTTRLGSCSIQRTTLGSTVIRSRTLASGYSPVLEPSVLRLAQRRTSDLQLDEIVYSASTSHRQYSLSRWAAVLSPSSCAALMAERGENEPVDPGRGWRYTFEWLRMRSGR